ncbi:MAG TPA: nucleotidyltransferase domain-containing protein [Gemmatimonadaceae bacterium]|jgi:hypothetical protein|nr:nucleotidyltransferase domain-containing protein [Gemmatimonadaceae bacterium]
MTLDEMVTALREAHGDALRAVVLYGSAAAGAQVARRSDYNLLVLAERLPLEALERVARHTAAWLQAGNPPPLTMTSAEWRGSADIFPMEYADVLATHQVLFGALPTEGITVTPKELRLQVEQEAMGKLLRLRRAVEATGGAAERELELLAESLSSFLTIFRSVLRLDGQEPPRDPEQVIGETARRAGFDPYPFARALQYRRGDDTAGEGEARTLLAGYLAGAEALVAYVNRHPVVL